MSLPSILHLLFIVNYSLIVAFSTPDSTHFLLATKPFILVVKSYEYLLFEYLDESLKWRHVPTDLFDCIPIMSVHLDHFRNQLQACFVCGLLERYVLGCRRVTHEATTFPAGSFRSIFGRLRWFCVPKIIFFWTTWVIYLSANRFETASFPLKTLWHILF